MEYKVSILCMMNLTISGKQNIEFYLLMVGLGAAEAYKYKHISLGVFESLHYNLSMIVLIDEYQLSKDLREIVFQGMGMEDIVDAAEWFEDFDWESHLRDAIDYLELDCISRLMEPSYHTCINDFTLFDVPNTDSVEHLYISFVSHHSFEQIMMIFMLGYTVFLIELGEYCTDAFDTFKRNYLTSLRAINRGESEVLSEVLELFDSYDNENDFLSNKRQQLWLRKISIDLRGHFFRLKESSMRYRSEKGLVYYRRPKETILN